MYAYILYSMWYYTFPITAILEPTFNTTAVQMTEGSKTKWNKWQKIN
jgi:hypothetical protein